MVNEEIRPQTPIFAFVPTGTSGKTQHMIGLPSELGGPDPPIDMPPTRYVLLQELDEGIFLFRFAEDGADAGDTWHESTEDAMHQAEFEFGISGESRRPVPTDVDPKAHVGALVRGEAGTA